MKNNSFERVVPKEVEISHEDDDNHSELSNIPSAKLDDNLEELDDNKKMKKVPLTTTQKIYQMLIERKSQDLMTIMDFVKKEFFKKVR